MTRAGFGSALHRFISDIREIARGMTDVGVGSGALLAAFWGVLIASVHMASNEGLAPSTRGSSGASLQDELGVEQAPHRSLRRRNRGSSMHTPGNMCTRKCRCRLPANLAEDPDYNIRSWGEAPVTLAYRIPSFG
jgi:hypothetical protein